MDEVLEEMEFLALSANRVDVLRLVAKAPQTRAELQAETGASQPTLGRILRDFETRRWVQTDAGTYTATATGRLVADGLSELYASLETDHQLRDLVDWLPVDELTFDLRALNGATITVPTQTRPSAPVTRVIDLVESATRVSVLSHAFNEQTLRAVTDWVTSGGTFSGVFSKAAIEPVADDAVLAQQLRTLLAADTARIRIYDGPVPLAVTVTDTRVSLLLRDDAGRLEAAIDTDNETVRSWAMDVYQQYDEQAEPLSMDR